VDQKIAESLAAADGQVTLEDKYRVALFRGELLQRKTEAEKGLRLARAALASTLAMPEQEMKLKDEPLPASPDVRVPSQDEVVRQAERERPDLKGLDQAVIAFEEQAKASWAAQLPQFFAAGTFAYSRAPNRDIQTNPWISDYFNTLALGMAVGLRQNLSFPTLHAQEKKAQSELVRVKAQREGLVRLISLQALQAIADLQAAVDRYAAAQGALSAGRSWFRSAGLNFGAGVSDAKALVEAYTGYAKTQVDTAQATYELLVARAHLEQVTGKSLSSGEPNCVLP
ncbi:MAG TPA: TolC family protein, partial [Myxococcaceae bacterium]|nr:TolC family protein [Myxococcaceae bacterium]